MAAAKLGRELRRRRRRRITALCRTTRRLPFAPTAIEYLDLVVTEHAEHPPQACRYIIGVIDDDRSFVADAQPADLGRPTLGARQHIGVRRVGIGDSGEIDETRARYVLPAKVVNRLLAGLRQIPGAVEHDDIG